ncbi:unnamed protein product, partial [Owenia fusiformis]
GSLSKLGWVEDDSSASSTPSQSPRHTTGPSEQISQADIEKDAAECSAEKSQAKCDGIKSERKMSSEVTSQNMISEDEPKFKKINSQDDQTQNAAQSEDVSSANDETMASIDEAQCKDVYSSDDQTRPCKDESSTKDVLSDDIEHNDPCENSAVRENKKSVEQSSPVIVKIVHNSELFIAQTEKQCGDPNEQLLSPLSNVDSNKSRFTFLDSNELEESMMPLQSSSSEKVPINNFDGIVCTKSMSTHIDKADHNDKCISTDRNEIQDIEIEVEKVNKNKVDDDCSSEDAVTSIIADLFTSKRPWF